MKLKDLLFVLLVAAFPVGVFFSCDKGDGEDLAYTNTITVNGSEQPIDRVFFASGPQAVIGLGAAGFTATLVGINSQSADLTSSAPWGIEFVIDGGTTYEGSVDKPNMITGGTLYVQAGDDGDVEARFEFTTTDHTTISGNYKGAAALWD